MTISRPSLLLSSLFCASALFISGCGGGGGGNEVPAANQQPAAPPAGPQTLVQSNYQAGSEELAAFNVLNTERARCGFGTLLQSPPLDVAARAHADYQIINNLLTHLEDASQYPKGFTGARPVDRVRAAGYTNIGGVTDEIVSYMGTSSKAGLGTEGVRGLLSAPYHLRGLLGGYRDVGVSVRSSADVGATTQAIYLQINAAYKADAGPQLLAAGDVNTYPCEGTSNVNFKLSNETPNPVPNRDLAVSPLGPVIYIGSREGNTLVISSSSMINLSTGRQVLLRAPVSAQNDPYSPCQEGCFKAHQAYIAADAPVTADTAFQMSINGTNNGAAFSRTFTFRTGAGG